MRFWRRNVPNEPTPDTDTLPPAAEPDPVHPEQAAEHSPAAEAEHRRGWFGWRRGDAAETVSAPEPPEPELPEPEPIVPKPTESEPAEADAPAAADTAEPPAVETAEMARESFEPAVPEPVTAPPPSSFLEPSPPPTAAPEAAPAAADLRGWFGRLRAGLSRSSNRLNEGINTIFARRRLDAAALEELEELLIASDMGTGVAGEVVERLRGSRFNQEIAPQEVREALAEEVIKLIEWVQKPLRPDPDKKPFVILVIGVNGSGKTTTIGKLAKQYRDAGTTVILAAGDTFRAAAVEQLQIWGERAGCPVVARPTGSDSAGLAYDALEKARAEKADLLLIDTAGRLHNKADLMGELQKIVRVLKKLDPEAPHSVLLVLDATVGQNAHAQAETFRDMIGVTGIVMTKLDGTAKGGVLVSLAEKYGIPIHAIGIGETAEDLRPFDARAYARSLVGLEV
jgi:fused signal recognition particle receptor